VQATIDFLIQHGHLIVFVWVLLAQAGLPLPTVPLLLAAGALCGGGRLDVFAVTGLSVLASVASDSVWYRIGKGHGRRVLGLLCRISLEPETCVRGTEATFRRHGAFTVVLAKFVPGLATVTPPLAGIVGVTWPRFLLLDTLGALLWTAAFVGPGYLLRDRIEDLAENAALTGAWLLGLLGAVVVLFVLVKLARRHRLLRHLRLARILPAELQALLVDPDPPLIVDLRTAEHFAEDPRTLPGALRFTVEQFEANLVDVPRDRDVVLYCT
jgi:membrane protein DedA with SNARE-associated domain